MLEILDYGRATDLVILPTFDRCRRSGYLFGDRLDTGFALICIMVDTAVTKATNKARVPTAIVIGGRGGGDCHGRPLPSLVRVFREREKEREGEGERERGR